VRDTPQFLGYVRSDGRVGVRNYVLVVPTVICSAVVCERIAATHPSAIVALPHLAGCGQLGPDMLVTHQTLAAKGSFENPLTRAEEEEKARDLLAPVLGRKRSDALLAALWDFENIKDVRALRTLYAN